MRRFFTRIRHALFGRPLTHEEATVKRDAEIARQRVVDEAANRTRPTAVQSQSYFGM